MKTKQNMVRIGLLTLGLLLLPMAARAQTLGTTNLLEGPAAGSDSMTLLYGYKWLAQAQASWIHLSTANQSGSGSMNVVFTFDANPGPTRTGTLTIAGVTVTVKQAGVTYVAANPVTTLVATNLNGPAGVAVDGAGNVYFTDLGNFAIKKWSVASNTVTTLASNLNNDPISIAVDGAGNVYFSEVGYLVGIILEWSVTNHAVTTVVDNGSLSNPTGIALDSSGNLYIADTGHSAIKECLAGSHTLTTLVTNVSNPMAVEVDKAFNVYFNDGSNIQELLWAYPIRYTLVGSGLTAPQDMAMDGAGNIYIADGIYHYNFAVKKWIAASNSVTTLVSGLNSADGVAVDGAGNVYFADYGNNVVKELPYAFVDPSPKGEAVLAGSDVLPVVLPAKANLAGPFAPASDAAWLTISGVTNGVVSFAFTATTTNRTALITVLGQSIAVSQILYTYATNNGTITITGYTGNPSSMVLPNTVNGYPVTCIATDAFYICPSLTSVTIPDSVTNLGFEAFSQCQNLTNLNLGNGVISIGDRAFEFCTALPSVNIPNSVKSLGNYAFANCSILPRVTIPSSVTSIGQSVFYNCHALTNLVISNSATSIGQLAFQGCPLASVNLGNGVTSIGQYAFQGCPLTSITIPSSVTNLAYQAFQGCPNLTNVYFGGNATGIDPGAFNHAGYDSANGIAHLLIHYIPGTTGWDNYVAAAAPYVLGTVPWLPLVQASGTSYGAQTNQFGFNVNWASGQTVVVDASTNLQSWTPLITNMLVTGTNAFNDSKWTNYPQRFYRVRSP